MHNMWSTVTFHIAAQTASGSQSASALSYPVSNIDAWSMNLGSIGGELAVYSKDQSLRAVRLLSAFYGHVS